VAGGGVVHVIDAPVYGVQALMPLPMDSSDIESSMHCLTAQFHASATA